MDSSQEEQQVNVMDVEPVVETTPPKSKKSSSSSKKEKPAEAELPSPKKAKKARSKVVEEEPTKAKKKSSSSSSSKKQETVVATAVATTPTKKRKAEGEAGVVTVAKPQTEKKAAPDQNTPEKLLAALTMLSIKCDEKQLRAIKIHCNEMYVELFKIAGDEAAKGLIYAYTVSSPIGRMFWYSPEEKRFKSTRAHLNLITLKKYEKETLLNLATIKETLTEEQRKKALACVGVASTEEEGDEAVDSLKPEQWLYALIESGVLRRRSETPDYKEKVEHCLWHDTEAKQTFWLGAKACKTKLNRVVLSRERTVNEKNIEAEYERLLKKRAEIAAYLKKALMTTTKTATATAASIVSQQPSVVTVTTPKKPKITIVEKKPVAAVVATPAKKKPVPRVPAPVATKPAIEKDEDSESASVSSIFSLSDDSDDDDNRGENNNNNIAMMLTEEEEAGQPMSEEKARLIENIRRKQALGHKPNTDPRANSMATSLQVSRNVEHCRKRQRLLHDDVEPEIKWFREECI